MGREQRERWQPRERGERGERGESAGELLHPKVGWSRDSDKAEGEVATTDEQKSSAVGLRGTRAVACRFGRHESEYNDAEPSRESMKQTACCSFSDDQRSMHGMWFGGTRRREGI